MRSCVNCVLYAIDIIFTTVTASGTRHIYQCMKTDQLIAHPMHACSAGGSNKPLRVPERCLAPCLHGAGIINGGGHMNCLCSRTRCSGQSVGTEGRIIEANIITDDL